MKLLEAFVLPSWRVLAVLGVGLVLVSALAAGGWLWAASQEQRAATAYAAALARVASAPGQPATPEAKAAAQRELEAALARYPSAALAGQAAYTLGNLRYADRDYSRARAAYEIATARAGSRTVRTLARAGIGYTWEAERNLAKAGEVFQAGLTELKPADFHYEELLMDLARVQEAAGRRDEAIQTYRRVLREVPRSLRADDVLTRLANLGTAP